MRRDPSGPPDGDRFRRPRTPRGLGLRLLPRQVSLELQDGSPLFDRESVVLGVYLWRNPTFPTMRRQGTHSIG